MYLSKKTERMNEWDNGRSRVLIVFSLLALGYFWAPRRATKSLHRVCSAFIALGLLSIGLPALKFWTPEMLFLCNLSIWVGILWLIIIATLTLTCSTIETSVACAESPGKGSVCFDLWATFHRTSFFARNRVENCWSADNRKIVQIMIKSLL